MAARQRTDPRKEYAMTTPTTADDVLRAPPVGRYGIDPRASTVTFKSRHLFGLAPVAGTMAIRDGLVDIADPLTGSSVQVEIDTASFDTGSGQRDRDVRSPRFLDAERYPSMTFTSERLDRSEGRWTLAGTLLVRDVARPVSLAIERSTVPPGRPTSFVVCAATRIDRTEFGLTAAKGLAGRHIDISLRIQGVRR
jgi:polyisoprenoid-binding protein YceI